MFTHLHSRRRAPRLFQPGNQFASRDIRLEPRFLAAPAIYRFPNGTAQAAGDFVMAGPLGGGPDADIELVSASYNASSSADDGMGNTVSLTVQAVNSITDVANPAPPAGADGVAEISMSAYIQETSTGTGPLAVGGVGGIGEVVSGNRNYQLADNGQDPVSSTATVTETLEFLFVPPRNPTVDDPWGMPGGALIFFNSPSIFIGVNPFAPAGFNNSVALGGPTEPGLAVGGNSTVTQDSYSFDPLTGTVDWKIVVTTPVAGLTTINPATNQGGIAWGFNYWMTTANSYTGSSNTITTTLTVNYDLSITSS